jgi:hypothetical protein
MWIGEGAMGGLDAPSKPICRGCLPAREARKGGEGGQPGLRYPYSSYRYLNDGRYLF